MDLKLHHQSKDFTLEAYQHFYKKPIYALIKSFLHGNTTSHSLSIRLSAKLKKDKPTINEYIKKFEEKELENQKLTNNELVFAGDYYRFFDTNYSKAFIFYQQAANKGNMDAINNFGRMYISGCGVGQDIKQAKNYFEQGVENNHAGALNNLGSMYRLGLGFNKPNYEKAMVYYNQAAELDHASALYNLGNIYYEIYNDYHHAKTYFEKSAKNGSTDALFNLAIIYHKGGVITYFPQNRTSSLSQCNHVLTR